MLGKTVASEIIIAGNVILTLRPFIAHETSFSSGQFVTFHVQEQQAPPKSGGREAFEIVQASNVARTARGHGRSGLLYFC